jgi:hypothetical protein
MQQIKNKKTNKDQVVESKFGPKVVVSDDLIRVIDIDHNVIIDIGKRGIKIDIDDMVGKHANVYVPRENVPSTLDCVYSINNDPIYILTEDQDNTGHSNEVWFDFVNVNS